MSATLRIGVAGAARGGGYTVGIQALHPRAALGAVYDPNPDAGERFVAAHPEARRCESFAELIDAVDAVILASPQHHHAAQAAFALERGVHVLSEVPAAVSMEQVNQLLAATRASSATYMLSENYCYSRPNLLVREIVRAGLLGELYFGESEYLHELKSAQRLPDGQPSWRSIWQVGRDGHTYPTHSLGPLLQWMDDRVTAVSCMGSGHHVAPQHEIQDTVTLTARTRKGALLRIRLDLLSNRPHLMDYYAVQGTLGSYESARAAGQIPRIYLHEPGKKLEWEPLEALTDRFLPERYARPPEGSGHWGSDAWPVMDFVDAVVEGRRVELDVYAALDMTLPGIVSEASIATNGAWLPVPDPRTLTAGIGTEPGREAPRA
jgi:predicted dehydrogenase